MTAQAPKAASSTRRERRSRRRRQGAGPDARADREAAREAARQAETQRIRDLLSDRVEEVLDWLIPGARWSRDGSKALRCGNIYGGPGTGFRVSLEDGRWTDFYDGARGDLLALIRHVRGGDWKATFDDARAFLGLDDESEEGRRRAQAAAEKAARARIVREERAARDAARVKERVRQTWAAARGSYCTHGSIAERYFREVRRIDVPTPCRFLPDAPYWDISMGDKAPPYLVGRFPAVVTPFVTGKRTVSALHLTFLDPDPPHGKIDLGLDLAGEARRPAKKFLGRPSPDSWLRLTEERETMAVGEGIETVQTAVFLKPGWGGAAAGSVDRLPLIAFGPGVKRIILLGERGCAPAKDRDGRTVLKDDGAPLIPAEEATWAAARAYAALPHRPHVEIKWFQGDLNDVLRGVE